MDDFREKRKLELEEEIRNLQNSLRETRPIPRMIIIIDTSTNEETYANASQYCWDNYLECDSRMKSVHPYDSTEVRLITFTPLDNNLQLYVDRDRGVTLPYPTKIEAYTYYFEKNLHLYQSFDVKTDKDIFNLTLPKEPNIYVSI